MMVGMSKRLKTMAGISIFAGVRITKRNASYMIIAMFFILMLRLMWYMLIGAGWLSYFMLYGIFLCYKYMFLGAKWLVLKVVGLFTGNGKGREAENAEEEAQ